MFASPHLLLIFAAAGCLAQLLLSQAAAQIIEFGSQWAASGFPGSHPKKTPCQNYAEQAIKTICQNKQAQSCGAARLSLKPCVLVYLCVSVRADILAVGCFARMHLRLFAENGSAALRPSGWQPDIRQKPGTSTTEKVELSIDNGTIGEVDDHVFLWKQNKSKNYGSVWVKMYLIYQKVYVLSVNYIRGNWSRLWNCYWFILKLLY